MYPDKKLNILWITAYPIKKNQHPVPWVKTLADAIVEEKHSLTLLTVSSKLKKIRETTEGSGYKLIVIPYKGGLRHLITCFYTQIYSLSNYLKQNANGYDVIHVHGTELQYASALINSKIKLPFITSIQGLITLCRKELKFTLGRKPIYWTLASQYEQFEIKNSNNFFVRTHWDKAFIKSTNPNAHLFECWEILRNEFYNHNHSFLGNDILFMGGSTDLKGLDIVLMSFDKFLQMSKSNACLHIVGFVKENFISNVIKNKNLQYVNNQNIVLHGTVNAQEICNLYSKCFCLYHPSLLDNSPNSVCEAQLAGLPVIATNVGGVSSLITDGENGLLVTKNMVEEHAAVLNKLYSNKDLQIKLSISAKKMATRRHDKKVIVANTINTYQKIQNNNLSNLHFE